MGDLAKDINSKFENNRVKALLNIIYTARNQLERMICCEEL